MKELNDTQRNQRKNVTGRTGRVGGSVKWKKIARKMEKKRENRVM